MSGARSGRPPRRHRPGSRRPRPDRPADPTARSVGEPGPTAARPAGGGNRTGRDARRRALGQNFLVDQRVLGRILSWVGVAEGELVLEPGAGTGALTLPLARAGARVMAVELDPAWARRLRLAVERAGLADRVVVVEADALTVALPDEPYRVVANPPFGATTDLLRRLLDRPAVGPDRVDLLVQVEVARKRAADPPTSLRSAAWAPWWSVELGPAVPRRSFRPVPAVDAAVLTYHRRRPPVLPERLAPGFDEVLRPVWSPLF